MRFDTGSPKVCGSIRTAAHWVHRDGGPGLFPCPYARVRSTVHQVCDRLAWTLSTCRLFRAPSPSPRLAFFRARAHCQGFRALLATSPVRVHSRPGSPPGFGSVLRRSQPPDGFLRAPAPGLVSSPSRVQDTHSTVQGLLSPRRATGSSPGAFPHAVGEAPLTGVTARWPRSSRLDSEASLCAGPRSRSSSYSPERRSLPSSVFAPPGSPSPGPNSDSSELIRSRRS